jgi:hypothetical protein
MSATPSANSQAKQYSAGGEPQESLVPTPSVSGKNRTTRYHSVERDFISRTKLKANLGQQEVLNKSGMQRRRKRRPRSAVKSADQSLFNQDKMSAFTPGNAPSSSKDGGVTENADATDNQQRQPAVIQSLFRFHTPTQPASQTPFRPSPSSTEHVSYE